MIIVDSEGDGLTPTKIHVLSWQDSEGIHSTKDYDRMREVLCNTDRIVCHNVARFDKPVFERILEISLKHVKLVDTLALSWTLYPNRHEHGLESWAKDLGTIKPEIEDWHNLTYEQYKFRCENDVNTNKILWDKMWSLLWELYGNESKIWEYVDYLAFKMQCAARQEHVKWKIDVNYITSALEELEIEKGEKFKLLKAAMPPVAIIKKQNRPKMMYKKDGTLSEAGKRWEYNLTIGEYCEEKDEVKYPSGGFEEPNPDSPTQVKAWLFELGWVPDTFDYKKNKAGELKEIPQINKDRGEGLTDSVMALVEKEPAIEALEGYSVLSHRIPFLHTMLEYADDDNFIYAPVNGLTNTLRFQHKRPLANLPGSEKPYAAAIRGSLIARYKNSLLMGSDLSSLEDCIKQHFMFKFDPELVMEMNVEGYDPHLKLAETAGVVTAEEILEYKAGDNPSLKPTRTIYKTGNYACQYGAFPPRIALTCGVSLAKAQEIFDAYWEVNSSIKKVAEEQVWKEVEDQKWLLNPINGFWYSLRATKDIFSTLVQGTASFIFDLWLNFVLQRYNNLLGQFHDEFIIEILDTEQEDAKQFVFDCIEKTNAFLQLNRELGCDVQFGKRYSDIH